MKQSKLFSKFNLKDRITTKQIKEFEKRYETFTEIPLISGGFIANASNKSQITAVNILKTQQNIRQKVNRKYLESYVYSDKEYKQIPFIWNVNPTSICPSPSRNKMAVINKIQSDNEKKDKTSVIEIYDSYKLIDTIYPPSSTFADIHKKEPFYGLSWNNDETLIAFIAEKAVPKSTKFFKDNTLITKYGDDKKDTAKEDESFGASYEFKEDFGEQMDGAKATTLFVYDLQKKQLFEPALDSDLVFSECVFDPNDSSSIIAVTYDTFPRRLGVRFYNSRPTRLWCIKLPKYIVPNSMYDKMEMIRIAANDFSPQYPRFSPNGESLVYLTTDNTFSHLSPSRLRRMKWQSNQTEDVEIETIIDIPTNVTSKDVLIDDQFGGIFCYGGVPIRCWINEDTMIINSLYGHVWGALIINLTQKTMCKLDEKKTIQTRWNDIGNEICRDITVLDVDYDSGDVLFTTSSIQRGHTANIYNINTESVHTLTTCVNDSDNDLIQSIRDIKTQIITNKIDDADSKDDVYESILYLPPANKTSYESDPVLLLYMHGGPHSASTLCYSYSMLSLLYSGFAVLQVNYRGSIGVSQQFVECLQGHIGSMDVVDCMNAFNYVCANSKQYLSADKIKKIVMGGSHGGFLTGHVIGQYPDVFLAASSRNPVLNLVSMLGLSDIPDWVLCECGINKVYDEECLMKPLSIKQMEIINQKSPHVYIENVKTPYQILCGSKDLRCPMQQALDYYKMLKARNGNEMARFLVYPDCQHSLNDTIDQEYDAWCSVWAWFSYHIRDVEKTQNKSEITDKIDNLLTSLSEFQ
eukprot:235363_1